MSLKLIWISIFEILLLKHNLLQSVHGMGDRDGILTATYEEVLMMKEHDINYMHRPLIVTDSPQSQWPLPHNLEEVFGSEYAITADQQTTNCSCLEQTSVYLDGDIDLTDLCEHYASALLYKGVNDDHYKYWERFEGSHKFTSEGEKCVYFEELEMMVEDGMKDLRFIEENPQYSYADMNTITNASMSGRDEISKFRSYFRLFGFEGDYEEVDEIQLNVLDQIMLAPFFKIFNMNGYKDVSKLHIWFGTEYYRAIRHYDKSDNIFFLLKGM